MHTLTIPKISLPAMIDAVAQSLRTAYPEVMKPIDALAGHSNWKNKIFIIRLVCFQNNKTELKLTYEAKTISKEAL